MKTFKEFKNIVNESSEIDKVVARIGILKDTLRRKQREAGGPGEMSDTDWEADQEERIDDAEKKLRDLKAAGHKVKSIGSGPRTASGRSDVGGPGVRENVKEAFFKVNIPNVAPTFVEAGSAAAVKMNMRKIMKPDAIKELEIERVTPAAMKKMYRDMAQGKEAEEKDEK